MDSQTMHRWPELTDEERKFISFWENERERRRRWTYALRRNLPMGVIFGAPIALFFFVEAPRHRGLISHTDLIIIMIGVLLTAVFYAIFRGSAKWDQYESHYRILKMKENQDARPEGSTSVS